MIRSFLLLSLLSSVLLGREDLYEKAQSLENQGLYKQAMEIYKKIAIEHKNELRSKEDKITQAQLKDIKKSLEPISDKKTEETIEQILTSDFNLYAYKQNYFLPISYDTQKRDGREQSEAKFQFSIKKPLSYNLLGFNETINFGYTQTSWWQIYKNSAPFRESNYQPEIFAVFPYKSLEKTALKAYQIGLIHESNGQGGDKSRSWNRLYLQGYFQLSNLFISPKVWYRLPESKEEDDNPNIEDYLGYGELEFFYPYKEHTFSLMLRNNLKFNEDNRGFAELNWTFPLFGSKQTFGFVQLSSGYGDSLIDYDKEINRASFGISLSR